jgi:hypothetical protein
MCQNIKCSGQGSRYGGGEPVRDSSEAETRVRGCLALERGGVSPEGATSPRARWRLTRAGDQPSSEEEPHPRGRPALERGGTSPEGASDRGGVSIVRCCAPRAKRSFARGWLGLTVLVGRWGRQDRGPLLPSCDCFGCVLCL